MCVLMAKRIDEIRAARYKAVPIRLLKDVMIDIKGYEFHDPVVTILVLKDGKRVFSDAAGIRSDIEDVKDALDDGELITAKVVEDTSHGKDRGFWHLT